jgi:hypothetical protein
MQCARESIEKQEEVVRQLGVSNNIRRQPGEQVNGNEAVGTSILGFVAAKLSPQNQAGTRKDLESRIVAEIYKSGEFKIEDESDQLYVAGPRRGEMETAFLARLCYSGMEDREERIAKAHEKTFQWGL